MNLWEKLPKPFFVLAPMEDVTDTVFRRIVATCGRPDVFFTEFTSADGLCSAGREGVSHRLMYTEDERPLVAQIWGNNPENYYKSCKHLVELGFDGVDINMGCPVSKIVKNNCCSALIDHPEIAKELIQAAVEGAGELPVTVKTRIGFKTKKTEEWARFLLEQELPALTFHARTAKQMSKVPADWNEIKKIVDLRNEMKSKTLIIGNGDIESREDALQKQKESGVDGLMVGRGIFRNPYIFNKEVPNDYYDQLPPKDKLDLLLRHAKLHREVLKERKPYDVLKKFYKIYVHGFSNASELRASLMETKSVDDAKSVIFSWLEEQEKIPQL